MHLAAKTYLNPPSFVINHISLLKIISMTIGLNIFVPLVFVSHLR
jgi:hypothetical protein